MTEHFTDIRIGGQRSSNSLWGITVYYNPARYHNKLDNITRFACAVRAQGLRLLVVELLFGDNTPELDVALADVVIRFRTDTILWHKERLLNLALRQLPEDCDKVAWLDGDLIFDNDHWVADVCELLTRHRVIQLFETAYWLSSDGTQQLFRSSDASSPLVADPSWYALTERSSKGLAYRHQTDCDWQALKGHPGFAWAAQRSVLTECMFYDRLILGGGDAVIASGFLGLQHDDIFLQNLAKYVTPSQMGDVLAWMRDAFTAAQGRISFVPGAAFHLWHGRFENRKYLERLTILKDGKFDPQTDLICDHQGLWTWNSPKPLLHEKVTQYFHERKEDDPGEKHWVGDDNAPPTSADANDDSAIHRLIECPFCSHLGKDFEPHGLQLPAFDRLSVMGAGYRRDARCPQCSALDRERLVYIYLRDCTNLLAQPLRVLHIAPERSLAKVFLALSNIHYETADLQAPYVHHHFNIIDIPFENDIFDLIICNHVLEHVEDDRKAIGELFRILRCGGTSILQVPLSLDLLHTYEDATKQSPSDREAAFGQSDHVRIYGPDYISRLQDAGFTLMIIDPCDSTNRIQWQKYGISPIEKLFVAQKLSTNNV
jgi:Methylase involved in ubiquinone/menaquinone biosynthesis